MRILVTGHTGYIGSVLCPRLSERGYDVVGLDTGFFGNCLLGEACDPADSRALDLRDSPELDLQDVDAVIHLGALSNDPWGDLSPELTRQINHHATLELARAARRGGVERFLFSSSCSMYGAGDPSATLDETAPFRPLTVYAESKIACEKGLSELADATFSPVYLRNATAYGYSPRLRLDLVVNDLTARALTSGKILMKSDGTPWRPLVHVEDICAAFEALLEAPREAIHDRAFNVGRNRETYQVRDVARLVQEAVPGSEIAFSEGAGPDPRSYRVCFDRIATEIPGFQPRWTLAEGIQQLVEKLREHGFAAADVDSRRFVRLKQIRHLLDTGQISANLRWCREAV